MTCGWRPRERRARARSTRRVTTTQGQDPAGTLTQQTEIGQYEELSTEPEVHSRGSGALDNSHRRSSYLRTRETGHLRRQFWKVSESDAGCSGSETRSGSVRMACLCRPPCSLASHIGGVLVRGAEAGCPGSWTIPVDQAGLEGSRRKRIRAGWRSG